jgi:hypothetical protein
MILRSLQKLSLGGCLGLFLSAVASGAVHDDNTAGLLGTNLASAQAHSDYFQFFNLEAVADAQASPTEKCFKPSGSEFRQLVSVYVEIDSKQLITGLRVVIARSFIDDPKKSIFARDLIKSTLQAAVNATDAASLKDLATEILYRDAKGTVLTREQPILSETPSAAYLVVAGKSTNWESKLGSSKIRLSNQVEQNKGSLVITIRPE